VKCIGKPVCDSSKDFLTGGGWILPRDGDSAKANFAVAGGFKNGAWWGHLQYIDHGNGMKVKGTGVTNYYAVDATTRHIEGNCEINGAGGTYSIDVADNGEPGVGKDTFSITLSNGYKALQKLLSGGNIQLHTPCK
jgi:hypothetical protein